MHEGQFRAPCPEHPHVDRDERRRILIGNQRFTAAPRHDQALARHHLAIFTRSDQQIAWTNHNDAVAPTDVGLGVDLDGRSFGGLRSQPMPHERWLGPGTKHGLYRRIDDADKEDGVLMSVHVSVPPNAPRLFGRDLVAVLDNQRPQRRWPFRAIDGTLAASAPEPH
jgi:hypothetical protein